MPYLSEEVLKFLAATLISLELGLNDARDHIVAMLESQSCKRYAHRRVARCDQPDTWSIVGRELGRGYGRRGSSRHACA